MSFHAYAARSRKGRLRTFVYEPAPLGPADLGIRITHCGICHSDVHLVDGDWGAGRYPMIPGHEIVGTVAALGTEVRTLERGQRVGVGWQRGACFACEACGRGEENARYRIVLSP
ncbi:MAG TPA: alcohol dehydrogenase catalytic domain-containing protein [Vicinamibacteria bacterium]|nr:alcohol dehydrogenase catalytic domain-containing protein [Vicinamibacteria bacterium]